MAEDVFMSDRDFQLWSYVVSHRQLLLRSPKSDGKNTRIDILFKGVTLLMLETSIIGLTVRAVEQHSVNVQAPLSLSQETVLFQLQSKTGTGYVAAINFDSIEDDGEYFDESVLISRHRL